MSEDIVRQRSRRAGLGRQFSTLLGRVYRQSYRHPLLLGLHCFGSLLMAVCLGFIFHNLQDDLYGVQDRFGLLFFLCKWCVTVGDCVSSVCCCAMVQ